MIDTGMDTFNNLDDSSERTESEIGSDIEQNLDLLKKVEVNMQMYRQYLLWQG